MSILFLGKKNDPLARAAAEKTQALFSDVTVFETSKGDTRPDEVENWQGDWIISYLCQWVIPARLLERAKVAAINFHPGPPQYPGIGCTNFALYNEEAEFGVTCHHMAAKVDSGSVIKVSRFPVTDDDSVLSLTTRCYEHIASLFDEIIEIIHAGGELPTSGEHWTREPYTRKDLNELCRLTLDMDEEEIARRVRATRYPDMPGPYFELYGNRYILEGSKPIPR